MSSHHRCLTSIMLPLSLMPLSIGAYESLNADPHGQHLSTPGMSSAPQTTLAASPEPHKQKPFGQVRRKLTPSHEFSSRILQTSPSSPAGISKKDQALASSSSSKSIMAPRAARRRLSRPTWMFSVEFRGRVESQGPDFCQVLWQKKKTPGVSRGQGAP